jgi:hypothetical protein
MGSNETSISEMRQRVDQIARLITELHPFSRTLEQPDAKNEILKALFELTRQVEVVKKQLLRIEKGDSSTTL